MKCELQITAFAVLLSSLLASVFTYVTLSSILQWSLSPLVFVVGGLPVAVGLFALALGLTLSRTCS